MVGAVGVALDKDHELFKVSYTRGHGVLVTFKASHAQRLINASNDIIEFVEYHQAPGRNGYVTIKVTGNMVPLSENELTNVIEKVLGQRIIGGYFEGMKQNFAYIDFQDERVLETIKRVRYAPITDRDTCITFSKTNSQERDPNLLVFYRGLSRPLGEAALHELLLHSELSNNRHCINTLTKTNQILKQESNQRTSYLSDLAQQTDWPPLGYCLSRRQLRRGKRSLNQDILTT